jgi:hypothetical protein
MGRYLIKINAKQFTEIIYAALSGHRLLVDYLTQGGVLSGLCHWAEI